MTNKPEENQIILCGEVVKENLFPDLYKFAKNNLTTAEEMLQNMVKKEHEHGNKNFDIGSAIVILNSDLN
jgi:hypothetical protein